MITALRSLPRGERVVLAALAMIVVHLAFRIWAVAGSWFYSDDFIFLGTTALGGDTAAWLVTPHNIHFMPFALWLTTWVGHLAAFSWWAAATQIIVMQALAAIACWWMLRTLFGDRPGILLALGLYLVSPATVTTGVWWAAAINQLPHQIALFGAVAAHVHHLRTGRWSWALITSGFLVLGYASYTKTLLLPVLLLVITFVYFARGPFVVRLRQSIGGFWRTWVLQGALTLSYVWLYLTVVPSSPIPAPSVLFDTIDLSIVQAAVPSLFGGPWQWQTLGQPGGVGPRLFVDTPLLLTVLSWGLLFSLVTVQSLRYRRAWWPTVIVLGYAVASAGLVAGGRATAFGPEAAAFELRYFSDLAGVGALGLALTLMPLVGAPGQLAVRNPPVLRVSIPARWPRLLVGAVAVGALISSLSYIGPWHDAAQMPQRAYVNTVQEEAGDGTLQLADATVPDVVLWNAAFPASLASRSLAPLRDQLDFVEAGTDLQILDPTGRPVDAYVAGDPRSLPGPSEGCGYPVSGEQEVIGFPAVVDFPFWMTISYLAAEDGVVEVTAGSTQRRIGVEQGLHTIFMRTQGVYSEVVVDPEGSTALCIDAVRIGQLEAVPSQ